jgi:hypothetical protein
VGAYNIVSPSGLVSGQPEDISLVLSNLQAIQAVLNGGIDNTNINAAAAIAYSKLALANAIKLNADIDPATSLAIARLAGFPNDVTKALLGDGTWGPMAGWAKLYDSGALGAAAATIDSGAGGFSTSYTHLRVVALLKSDQAGGAQARLQFNGDTGANYDDAVVGAAQTFITLGIAGGALVASAPTALGPTVTDFSVPFYSTATQAKTLAGSGTLPYKYDNVNPPRAAAIVGNWRTAAAVTRIVLSVAAGNFAAGSRVMIYGY